MPYLYGDSTESSLEINYIEFLRDALDFSVEVLVAAEHISGFERTCAEVRAQTDDERSRVQTLADRVTRALDTPPGGPESEAARCAATIRHTADDAIERSKSLLEQRLAERIGQLESQIQRERDSNLRALSILLRQREMPGAEQSIELSLADDKTSYLGNVRGRSDLGLEWLQVVNIPQSSVFAQLLKVERVAPHFEAKVPEKAGLLRKGTKLKSHRFYQEYVAELLCAGPQTTIKLRSHPNEDDSGFNLLVSDVEPRVRLVRVQKDGEHSSPFEPVDEDVPTFLALAAKLATAADELRDVRGALREARIDGTPIGQHQEPSVLVQRLVHKLAPVVQEISRHSLSPEELVLKRILADDRREEIFAAKVDLLSKLEPVPPSHRGVFAPLGLGQLDDGAVARPMRGRPTIRTETVEPTEAETVAQGQRPIQFLASRGAPLPPPVPVPPSLPGLGQRLPQPPLQSDEEITAVAGAPGTAAEDSIDIAIDQLERET